MKESTTLKRFPGLFVAALAALVFAGAAAAQSPDPVVKLLDAKTTTGPGNDVSGPGRAAFQVIGQTSSGSGAATVTVQTSLDRVNYGDACTFTMTLSATASSGLCTINAPWRWIRGNVSAISGTGASVTLYMGR